MPVQAKFSDATVSALSNMVADCIANPGELIRLGEFDEALDGVDPKAVVDSLPEGLSEEIFVDGMLLAMLTECATDSYAVRIAECAAAFGAEWLGRFNEEFWAPDERTHYTPYKSILLALGYAEEELDRMIREARERLFIHLGLTSTWSATTFGTIQEATTDFYHGVQSDLFRPSAPHAARAINRIKKRETLHTILYADMTALQLDDRPELLPDVAESILRFEMPGNQVVPDLQPKSVDWLPLMGADFVRLTHDLVRSVHRMARDPEQVGRIVIRLAAEKDVKVRVSIRRVEAAMNFLGGPGYGLVGEAVLQRYVGPKAFLPNKSEEIDQGLFRRMAVEPIRGIFRSWIAKQLPEDVRMIS